MRKILLIFIVCFIIVCLFTGLYHLVRGTANKKGQEKSTVKWLTIRIIASLSLVVIILVISYFASYGT